MTTFDLWLTTQPTDDDIEPSQRHLEDARDQLSDEAGDMPSDDQVYALACMLAVQEAREAAIADEDECEALACESWRDDMEDRYGDGPL